nr:hypothetical protein [Virgisporangium aurantiacum]
MSRQELADAVNTELSRTDPREANLDANHIGKLERGAHRWPNDLRRTAFRRVLQVASDRDLGFYIIRGLSTGPADKVGSWPSPAVGGVVDRRALLIKSAALGVGAGLTAQAMIRQAAHDSTAISTAAADVIAPATVDEIRNDLRRLTTDYITTSDLPKILPDALSLRGRLATLLDDLKTRPKDNEELHLMMGATCLLLASISHDAGESQAGMAQAEAAETFAELAQHAGLLGWVLCAKAMIDLWRHRPTAVLEHAERGAAVATSTSASLRLQGLHARALAQLGRTREATAILNRTESMKSASGADPIAEYGSLFSFPESRQRYYTAVTSAHLGNCAAVERAVAELGHGDQPPSTGAWPVSWALSRSYLALARLDNRGSGGGPEAATAALAPVLTVPPFQRINQLDQVISTVSSRLTAPAYHDDRAARALADAIRDFRRSPRSLVVPS